MKSYCKIYLESFGNISKRQETIVKGTLAYANYELADKMLILKESIKLEFRKGILMKFKQMFFREQS